MTDITLNHGLIREMLNGVGPESTLELMGIYSDECRGRTGELRAFYEGKNFPELKRSAHSLKGASRTYGIDTLADVAYELEQAADDQSLDRATAPLVWIEENTEAALDALSAFVKKEINGA